MSPPFDPSDQDKRKADFGRAMAELETRLTLGIALRDNRVLRSMVLAGAPQRAVFLGHGTGHALITNETFVFERPPEHIGNEAALPLGELLMNPAIASAMADPAMTGRAGIEAGRLLKSLVANDRATFQQLSQWEPLIGPLAYAIGTRLIQILDFSRLEIRTLATQGRRDIDELLLDYRRSVASLGRIMLLATGSGMPWLGNMARSFTWTDWTPSWPHTRERDLWSSLIGARVASRFGPTAIPAYIERLIRSRHVFDALDALIGLAAIGSHHSSTRRSLIAQIEVARANLDHAELGETQHVASGFAQARYFLAEPPVKIPLRFDPTDDAFDADFHGRIRVFRLIPAAVESPAWKFIQGPGEQKSPSRDLARRLFDRAWGLAGVLSHPARHS